jgi:hypothetical protein
MAIDETLDSLLLVFTMDMYGNAIFLFGMIIVGMGFDCGIG